MASPNSSGLHQLVGVVGDVRRDMEGHHYAEKCSVFGINSQELQAIQSQGLVTRPREFSGATDRYQVLSSPWSVIRVLGVEFGYYLPVMPTGGLVGSDNGERRTCIFTLQKDARET